MATNPSLATYQNQRAAISGDYPTDSITQQIVSGEIQNAYGALEGQRALQLSKDREAESIRQFNENQKQQEKTRLASGMQGIGSSAMQLGTAYGLSDSHVLRDATKGLFPGKTATGFSQTPYTPSSLTPVTGALGQETFAPITADASLLSDLPSSATGFGSEIPTAAPITDFAMGGANASQAAFGSSIGNIGSVGGATQAMVSGELAPTAPSAPGMLAEGAGATGMLATAGEAIGGTVGGIAEMAGAEGAMSAGSAIGSTIGSGISAAAPYGFILPLASLLHSGVDSLFNINEDNIGKVIGDIFDPLKGLSDLTGGACIIVTACTDRNSPEVEIAREYRDQFLTRSELRGYYVWAEKIVPILNKYSIMKRLTKLILVDKLIEYGKFALGKGSKPSLLSIAVTKSFLYLCKKTGESVKQFTRINGEVY